MRSTKRVGLWALTALTLILVAPAPALAQTRDADGASGALVETRPAVASFEGDSVDLAGDWGDAEACLVWRQGGVLECFRTVAELDAREAELAPRRAAMSGGSTRSTGLSGGTVASSTASYSCSSSLRLYEHNYYSGRRLSFWDRGYWQNLYLYGFDNRTSSYIVGACYVHLAEHPDGGGWWYPGPTYPWAGEPAMWWQDVISSIYIE